MLSKTHKVPNYRLKAISLVFLGSVVACNNFNPGNELMHEGFDSSPVTPITQAMIDTVAGQQFDFLADVLQKLKQGTLVNNIDAGNAYEYAAHTALQYAAMAGEVGITKALLERNAHVNVDDRFGWTPLHIAAFQGNLAMVQLLLSVNGINIHAKTTTGKTPYMEAEFKKDAAKDNGDAKAEQNYQAIMDMLEPQMQSL